MAQNGSIIRSVKVVAPVNMALIKYWGKHNDESARFHNMPMNDSISINLNALHATTELRVSGHFEEDSVSINGVNVEIKPESRFSKVFKYVRESIDELDNLFISVASETNFPVSAGLASSAAGFSAIAVCFGQLFELNSAQVAYLARIGSGSACRSLYGGFVQWEAPCFSMLNTENIDFIHASPVHSVFPEQHWPELKTIIAVVCESEKNTKSTNGMERSRMTSELLTHRVKECVPGRVLTVKEAIRTKDFAKFGRIVMQDSNQLHAVCLDSFPPLVYLNATSYNLIELVHAFNEMKGEIVVAYTFDAGPNCCLFLEEKTVPQFLECLCHYFPNEIEAKFIRSRGDEDISPKLNNHQLKLSFTPHSQLNHVQYLIISDLGKPPVVNDNTWKKKC